jgi:hypothetical protein
LSEALGQKNAEFFVNFILPLHYHPSFRALVTRSSGLS